MSLRGSSRLATAWVFFVSYVMSSSCLRVGVAVVAVGGDVAGLFGRPRLRANSAVVTVIYLL